MPGQHVSEGLKRANIQKSITLWLSIYHRDNGKKIRINDKMMKCENLVPKIALMKFYNVFRLYPI